MPTDEQPATYFYGYYISFDATGVEPVDHVLKAVADAGRGSHHTEDWKELGLEAEIQRAAHEAAAVFQVRDAEVQALREQVDHAKRIFQNAEVRSGYCVCGDTPERHGLYAEACQYTDRGQWESELWLKRAALAGGEKGEAE